MSNQDWSFLLGVLIVLLINVWRFLTINPSPSVLRPSDPHSELIERYAKDARAYAKVLKKRRKRK